MHPVANFEASGRSCFIPHSEPETGLTGIQAMLEESSCKVSGPYSAALDTDISVGKMTVERQTGPLCPEVTEETK